MQEPSSELLSLLTDPAFSGPHNSAQTVIDALQHLEDYNDQWNLDLTLAVLLWLGTYVLPGKQPVLPCPPDQDLLELLPQFFNSLRPDPLAQFLVRFKEVLDDRIDDERRKSKKLLNELTRRSLGLDEFIERAEHNAKVARSGDYEEEERKEGKYCPICEKRVGWHAQIWCDHYFCQESDGYDFYWTGRGPHFFDEVDQLNRTINRPRTTDAVFESLVAAAPDTHNELFNLVRSDGADFWTQWDGVKLLDWEVNIPLMSTAYHDYFHPDPDALVTSVTGAATAALGWLKVHHPELVVKLDSIGDHFEARYWGGPSYYGDGDDKEQSFLTP